LVHLLKLCRVKMVCCTYLKLITNRIETMDGIFEVGDEVSVKLLDVDKQGKLKFRVKHYCQARSTKIINNRNL
jgi:polyribonucleotide nucleotidyltransferase